MDIPLGGFFHLLFPVRQIGINGVLVFVEGEKTEDLEKKLWSIDIRTNNKLYSYMTPGSGGKCSQHCAMPSPLHIGEYIYIYIYVPSTAIS